MLKNSFMASYKNKIVSYNFCGINNHIISFSRRSKYNGNKKYYWGISLTAVATRCSIKHGGLPEDADGA